ncbi:hypothetical protein ACFLWR_02825 [Chloroflexota bacterium]
MTDTENPAQVNQQGEVLATQRARDRAKVGRWDLNIAIFLFAVLILVIILATYTKAGIEIVAVVALFGLSMVWMIGWKRERQLFHRFYEEELANTEQSTQTSLKAAVKESVEKTIEEQVQKALRERWK